MERRFEGELTCFSCKWPFKKKPDRRHLWKHFATTVRIVPIPGRHGWFHTEPQFSALCRDLREALRRGTTTRQTGTAAGMRSD